MQRTTTQLYSWPTNLTTDDLITELQYLESRLTELKNERTRILGKVHKLREEGRRRIKEKIIIREELAIRGSRVR